MSRTKGSGWGGGVMIYQVCPLCGKKKVLYVPISKAPNHFKCTWCKKRFDSDTLLRTTYPIPTKIKQYESTEATQGIYKTL